MKSNSIEHEIQLNLIELSLSLLLQVHLPKTAKIFFQKSTKSDSSEGKSKIKSSLFSVIKSDKSKSSTIEKCSPAKHQSKSDDVQLAADLAAEEHFISKVSQSGLNKVKKSSSFSSTTSLATSSSSDTNHVNSTNKENDCELNNLISEFSDSFNALKGSYTIHPNVISNQANSQSNLPTRISLNQQFDATLNSSANVLGNSPPKPPSRAKSTSRSNKQREESVNSSTANSQESTRHPVQCAMIQITSQPSYAGENGQTTRRASSPAGVNFSENALNGFASQTANKLTISVQANDKNDRWFSDMKSELILNGQPNAVETAGNFGLWSSVENDLNKSKRSKSVKQLKFSEDARNKANSPDNKSSMIKRSLNGVEQQVASKSNTMELDLRLSMDRLKNSLLDKRDLMEKQSRPERAARRSDRPDRPRRSIDESVNKLASKSISRLADKSLGIAPQNSQVTSGGTVRNKSCSSLYQSSGHSEPISSAIGLKKSRIPLSKSSITLGGSRRPVDRTTISSPVCRTSPVLTDNCLEVPSSSSSSFCSLCSSMSDDSLDEPNQKQVTDFSSSLTSSLSNLNSSLDSNFEHSRMRTSHSMSKINQKLEILMSAADAKRTNNCPFRDGTRSLSNLTSYTMSGYTNRRLLKTNSNHLFQPIRELSRIEESLDDDQQAEQAKQSRTGEENKLDSCWLDYGDRCIRSDADPGRPLTSRSTNSDSQTNSHTNDSSSSTTFSRSDNLHGMDDSAPTNTSTNHASSSSTPVHSHNIASSDSASSPVHTSPPTNRTASPDHALPLHSATSSSSRPSLNQFKSSLINQLIDSNSHLKSNLGLDSELNNGCCEPRNGEPDECAKAEASLKSLNETEKSIFSSKKCLFAKNRSLMSKTDSCKSFELNEKIVDLEMQLTSHKQKFAESLNLIKLLSDHCNDLIEVFNENYNCKLKQIGDLLLENQRLIKLNDEYKMENLQLNETCDDLSRHLNQELNHPAYGPVEHSSKASFGAVNQALNQHLLEQYGKLKSALELYERVKSEALEKVER